MIDSVLLGISSLGFLILLIMLRMPVAYAMILVGGLGIMSVNGISPVFNQLKTLAYGQFSIYDLSVVPLFILMAERWSSSSFLLFIPWPKSLETDVTFCPVTKQAI